MTNRTTPEWVLLNRVSRVLWFCYHLQERLQCPGTKTQCCTWRRKLPLFFFFVRPWAHGGNPNFSPLRCCRFLENIFCTGLYLLILSAKCISCGPAQCEATIGEEAAQRPSCPGSLESSALICHWNIFIRIFIIQAQDKHKQTPYGKGT